MKLTLWLVLGAVGVGAVGTGVGFGTKYFLDHKAKSNVDVAFKQRSLRKQVNVGFWNALNFLGSERSFGNQNSKVKTKGIAEIINLLKYDIVGLAEIQPSTESTAERFVDQLNEYADPYTSWSYDLSPVTTSKTASEGQKERILIVYNSQSVKMEGQGWFYDNPEMDISNYVSDGSSSKTRTPKKTKTSKKKPTKKKSSRSKSSKGSKKQKTTNESESETLELKLEQRRVTTRSQSKQQKGQEQATDQTDSECVTTEEGADNTDTELVETTAETTEQEATTESTKDTKETKDRIKVDWSRPPYSAEFSTQKGKVVVAFGHFDSPGANTKRGEKIAKMGKGQGAHEYFEAQTTFKAMDSIKQHFNNENILFMADTNIKFGNQAAAFGESKDYTFLTEDNEAWKSSLGTKSGYANPYDKIITSNSFKNKVLNQAEPYWNYFDRYLKTKGHNSYLFDLASWGTKPRTISDHAPVGVLF